jgi:polysaccharide biosynthesis/export protein
MYRIFPEFFVLSFIFLFSSCASTDKFILLKNAQNSENKSSEFQAVLQPDDLLMIVFSSDNSFITQPYNLSNVVISNNDESDQGAQRLLSYQIDQEGNIQMPNLGTVKAAGKTRNELVADLTKLLEGKVKDPVITIRILNFKVSVQGEVLSPGTFPISTERVTLLEALSMAGGPTIYGRRDNILIIREENGVKSFQKVDITKSDFINSPFYYLSQNDMIYVEPNKTRVNSSVIGPNIGVALSAISLLVSILVLTTK